MSVPSAAGQGVGARWCGDGQVLLETPQCGLGVRHDNTTAVSPLASARVSRTRRRGHAHRASAGARATTRALRTAIGRLEISLHLRFVQACTLAILAP